METVPQLSTAVCIYETQPAMQVNSGILKLGTPELPGDAACPVSQKATVPARCQQEFVTANTSFFSFFKIGSLFT